MNITKILELLRSSKVIKQHEIISFIEGNNFFFIKAKAVIKDNSVLFLRIFLSKTDYEYSFHRQDKEGNLIARWDNSPHRKELKPFPIIFI